VLEIESLDVAYGEATALRGVSMSVPAGATVALIGSNGAGKTTLVKAIMGMHPARSGRIVFDGHDLSTVPAHRRPHHGMALVPEGRRLFPTMSVRDNLRLGLHDRESRARSRGGMDWVLELFPLLAERAKQPAGTLSGGEQQMVALGRALVSRPRLLILDEPSLGLAPVIVDTVFDTLRAIRDEGVTMLIAEQNMQAALSMSDQGHVLADGRLTLTAPADELLVMPEVRAAYLGAA
jgi:branched-chain amino acid transport system ATP-binding protein